MGYQNVGTPRFYINYLNYWYHSGLFTGDEIQDELPGDNIKKIIKLISMNPSSIKSFDFSGQDTGSFRVPTPYTDEQFNLNYMAVLGHSLNTINGFVYPTCGDGTNGYEMTGKSEIVNWTGSGSHPDYDGWSLIEFDGVQSDGHSYVGTTLNGVMGNMVSLGGISIGRYYNMPNSPDLSLTVTHEYGGVNNMETKGGASLSNALWTKPPDWGNLQAWQLGNWDWLYSGRRVWDLSFSYVSDENLEPQNYTGTALNESHTPGEDNFFQNVIHYTNGGQLPFLFCPDPSVTYDSNTWTVPELAICKFDMNSFSRRQVAHKVYNIKVKIREIW